MSPVILTKTYDEPDFNTQQILRYAGCKNASGDVSKLLQECIREIKDGLTYKVCYGNFDVSVNADICNFGAFKVTSKNLAANLGTCNQAIIFAATIGIQTDRLIAKYSRIAPSKALMFQAIGAERTEVLCDVFCNDIEKELSVKLKPRFSPGYGDLCLSVQKDIFAVLDCTKRIGVTLNDSLSMSPSKSVSAFVGLL